MTIKTVLPSALIQLKVVHITFAFLLLFSLDHRYPDLSRDPV